MFCSKRYVDMRVDNALISAKEVQDLLEGVMKNKFNTLASKAEEAVNTLATSQNILVDRLDAATELLKTLMFKIKVLELKIETLKKKPETKSNKLYLGKIKQKDTKKSTKDSLAKKTKQIQKINEDVKIYKENVVKLSKKGLDLIKKHDAAPTQDLVKLFKTKAKKKGK